MSQQGKAEKSLQDTAKQMIDVSLNKGLKVTFF